MIARKFFILFPLLVEGVPIGQGRGLTSSIKTNFWCLPLHLGVLTIGRFVLFRANYRTIGREITSSDRKRQKATGKRQEGQEIGR
ncbi:MAG: hypothetical protein F6K55_36030, partial [Moorea sp. SIO4A3]|nr:hypothetical protein [Moorena sp. SIO4A3]